MSIPSNQLLGPYTNVIADVYKQFPETTNFLRSYFPSQVEMTRYISYFVMRDGEQVAADVARGSNGNRNEWSKATEKIGDPPYFREFFDILSLQAYDALLHPELALTPAGGMILSELVRTLAEKQMSMRRKIERAIEIMCAQVLMTGVIDMTGNNGTGIQIDFKRQALSLPDTSGTAPWSTIGTDVYAQMEADCTFIRQYGKSTDMEFDIIMGNSVWRSLLLTTIFIQRQNLFNMKLDSLNAPTRVSELAGCVWHGKMAVGPYNVQVYTYPQTYDVISVVAGNTVRTPTYYVDDKKYVILPKTPKFKTFFGAVPPLVENGLSVPRAGDFVMTDWIAADKRSHNYDVESCPMPVPIAIDQMVTRKVLV